MRNDAPLAELVEASGTTATVTEQEPTEREAAVPLPDANAIRAAVRQAKRKKGLIIVNTGTGKGKTTAALGVMTRAWGRNLRIGGGA